MIHAIPFKVVHPCPRPRAVPPRATTTTTSRRSFLSIPARSPSCPRARLPLRRLLPFIPPSRSRAHARTCTDASLPLSLSLELSLSYYPPTGSLFLRVTTQWRCHTLAPSSNQCYCFIVPLLLLLLDTRKGDPSIPESVRERRGRVASLRASTRLALPRRRPRFVSRLTEARAKAEPSRAKRYEALYRPTGARIRSPGISR